MPSGRSSSTAWRTAQLRQRKIKELKTAILLGVICSGLMAGGIYLIHLVMRY
jgi:hypothetical protein